MNNSQIKSSLQASYDRHAKERDRVAKDGWKVEERNRFLSFLKENGAESLLEIGAGTGQDSLFFLEQGFDVTATDQSREMVNLCQAKNLTALQMDFYHLQFPSESFDAVWSLNCLLHVPKQDLPGVLAEIKRVLKPSGLFYMGVYGGKDSEGVWEEDTYEPKRFFAFYTDPLIRDVVGKYFEIAYFGTVDYGSDSLHFQSMILRNND